MMDLNTWVDPTVVDWLERYGEAIRLMSKRDRASLTRATEEPPAMVIFRNGAEVDRVSTAVHPWDLVGWLNALRQGLRYAERARFDEIRPRLRNAERLLKAGRFSQAAKEFEWLWRHMHEREPSMVGVRASFMASSIKTLVDSNPAARRRFTKIRDEWELVRSPDRRADWMILNRILGEEALTIDWIDQALRRKSEFYRESLQRSFVVTEILLEQKRWRDVGRLVKSDAIEANLRWDREYIETMRTDPSYAERREEVIELHWKFIRKRAGQAQATLRAAGRIKEAAAVRKVALEIDDSSAMRKALREWDRRVEE